VVITYLKKAKLLTAPGPGRFKITERGSQLLQTSPSSIDVNFLEQNYPEMLEFRKTRELEDEPPASFNEATGQWIPRAGAEDRLARLVENISPNEEVRLNALRFLALGIEVADQERDTAWYVKETGRGLRLMTGRLLAVSVSRLRARIGVLGPVREAVRQVLSIDAENEVATGKIIATHSKRRRRVEFLDFMDSVTSAFPDRQLHVILVNLNTHKKSEHWLLSSSRSTPRPCQRSLPPTRNVTSGCARLKR
jgi:hypothetical protein